VNGEIIMTVDIKKIEQIVEEEHDCLKSIHEGIVEGVREGIREGMVSGLKRGARDGLKECLAEGLGNVGTVEIGDILQGISEDIVKTIIRESAKNICTMSARSYIQGICGRVVNEVKNLGVMLSEAQVQYILDLVMKSEQEAVKWMMKSLPDNPFVKEFAAGFRVALENSLKEELKSCQERLRQNAASSS